MIFFISCLTHFFFDFQAPLPVKAYAKNLIEGIISDTITHVPISDDDDLADEEEDNDKCNINEETDVSLSLETDTAVANTAGSGPSTAVVTSGYPASVAATAILAATSTKSPSSHVETDSLDESEHAGQHSWIKNEQDWTWLNKIEQDWTRLNKIEQDWTRLNKIEQDLTRLNKIKQEWT